MRVIVVGLVLAISLASPVLAGEMSESELVSRTTLDPTELERRTAAIEAMSVDEQAAALEARARDLTNIYYQRGHGVFVEYTAADGRLFMWYRGNKTVVQGEWGVRTRNGHPEICFHYRGAVHGVTGEFEPTECINRVDALVNSARLDSHPGDPFGLASGKLPYSKPALDLPDWPKESETAH